MPGASSLPGRVCRAYTLASRPPHMALPTLRSRTCATTAGRSRTLSYPPNRPSRALRRESYSRAFFERPGTYRHEKAGGAAGMQTSPCRGRLSPSARASVPDRQWSLTCCSHTPHHFLHRVIRGSSRTQHARLEGRYLLTTATATAPFGPKNRYRASWRGNPAPTKETVAWPIRLSSIWLENNLFHPISFPAGRASPATSENLSA